MLKIRIPKSAIRNALAILLVPALIADPALVITLQKPTYRQRSSLLSTMVPSNFSVQALAEQETSSKEPIISHKTICNVDRMETAARNFSEQNSINAGVIVGPAYANPQEPPSDAQFHESVETRMREFIEDMDLEIGRAQYSLGEGPSADWPRQEAQLAAWKVRFAQAQQWAGELESSNDVWEFLKARHPINGQEKLWLDTVHDVFNVQTPVLFADPDSWTAKAFDMPATGAVTVVTHHHGRPYRFVLMSKAIKSPARAMIFIVHELLHVEFIPDAGFGNNFDLRLHEGLTAWKTRAMLADAFVHGSGPAVRRLRGWIRKGMEFHKSEIPPENLGDLDGAALWYVRFTEWYRTFANCYTEEVALVDWVHDRYPAVNLDQIYQTSNFGLLYRTVPLVERLKRVGNPLFYSSSIFHAKEVWRLFQKTADQPSAQYENGFWRAARTVAEWGHQHKGRLNLTSIFMSVLVELDQAPLWRVGFEYRLQKIIFEDALFPRLVNALAQGTKSATVLETARTRLKQLILDLIKSETAEEPVVTVQPNTKPGYHTALPPAAPADDSGALAKPGTYGFWRPIIRFFRPHPAAPLKPATGLTDGEEIFVEIVIAPLQEIFEALIRPITFWNRHPGNFADVAAVAHRFALRFPVGGFPSFLSPTPATGRLNRSGIREWTFWHRPLSIAGWSRAAGIVAMVAGSVAAARFADPVGTLMHHGFAAYLAVYFLEILAGGVIVHCVYAIVNRVFGLGAALTIPGQPAAPGSKLIGAMPQLTHDQQQLAGYIRENVPAGTMLPAADAEWLQPLLDATESVTAQDISKLVGVDMNSAEAIAKAVNDHRGFRHPKSSSAARAADGQHVQNLQDDKHFVRRILIHWAISSAVLVGLLLLFPNISDFLFWAVGSTVLCTNILWASEWVAKNRITGNLLRIPAGLIGIIAAHSLTYPSWFAYPHHHLNIYLLMGLVGSGTHWIHVFGDYVFGRLAGAHPTPRLGEHTLGQRIAYLLGGPVTNVIVATLAYRILQVLPTPTSIIDYSPASLINAIFVCNFDLAFATLAPMSPHAGGGLILRLLIKWLRQLAASTSPIRPANLGFNGERELYLKNVSIGILPAPLAQKAFSLPWPFDMSDPHKHIPTLYGGPNYSHPEDVEAARIQDYEDVSHQAIDIQTLKADDTEIRAIEKGIVVYVHIPHNPKMAQLVDVYVYSKASSLLWIYCHVDRGSLSEALLKKTSWDRNSNLTLEAGQPFGKVGHWHSELRPAVQVPPDVADVHGRSYDHLHLEVHYVPEDKATHTTFDAAINYINPILLLQRLYVIPESSADQAAESGSDNIKRRPDDESVRSVGLYVALLLLVLAPFFPESVWRVMTHPVTAWVGILTAGWAAFSQWGDRHTSFRSVIWTLATALYAAAALQHFGLISQPPPLLLTAAGLLVSIIIHEIGHYLVARAAGLKGKFQFLRVKFPPGSLVKLPMGQFISVSAAGMIAQAVFGWWLVSAMPFSSADRVGEAVLVLALSNMLPIMQGKAPSDGLWIYLRLLHWITIGDKTGRAGRVGGTLKIIVGALLASAALLHPASIMAAGIPIMLPPRAKLQNHQPAPSLLCAA